MPLSLCALVGRGKNNSKMRLLKNYHNESILELFKVQLQGKVSFLEV